MSVEDLSESKTQAHEPLLDSDARILTSSAEHRASDEMDVVSTCENRRYPTWHLLLRFAALAVCFLLLLWTMGRLLTLRPEKPKDCVNGSILQWRREWRSLKSAEQIDYVSAVQCLLKTPSKLNTGHTGLTHWYDFTWAHYNIGNVAHGAANFLSWHRWFIALFEQSLRKECHYTGPLPYWDWTLDWQHPEKSAVFDPETGFGGNGNPSIPSAVNEGWCVTDGPFAGLRVPFDYDAVAGSRGLFDSANDKSFCLSRKFGQGSTFNASHLNPVVVSDILSEKRYIRFLAGLEFGPHNDIPFGIGGSFKSLYAPADPIFWLHHIQLDRLWWIWQQRAPGNAEAYDGPSTSKSPNVSATLDDHLSFGGLSEDVSVRDIIDTQGGRLCYRYQ
ncbi:tyrosinase ustQ [Elsinoe australis]|uniref:Tyrosinase ustQ n=1 Tax=Elsinoe australis TaxID=40998 RepID=A0A4U7B5J3_9PEZI|nr:tyrosinase ustQ [Elsinoe australis]